MKQSYFEGFEASYKTAAFYPPDDVVFAIYSKRIWRRFILNLNRDAVMLDMGCGGGTVLHAMEDVGFRNIHGIDAVDAVPAGFVKHCQFTKGDVLHTPYPDAMFDGLVSTMVMEHVDDEALVREIARVLKPGGLALVTSILKGPNAWYWHRNADNEIVIHPDHKREYKSEAAYASVFYDHFEVVDLAAAPLVYPLVDPIYRLMYRLTGIEAIKGLVTTHPVLKLLRYIRIPIPGYKSVEIIVRRKHGTV